MIRSSIINALTAFLLVLLMAACMGVFIGVLFANPNHPLIMWLSHANTEGFWAIPGILLVIAISFRLVIGHYVSKPLYKVRNDIYALAHSDKNHVFHHHERDDEFGDVARTLHECRAMMLRVDELEAVESAKLRISAHRKEQLEMHIRAFESRVGQVVNVVSESAQALHTVAEALVNAVLLSQRQASQMRESMQQSSGQIAAIAKDSDSIHHSISDMVTAIQRATETSNGALSQTQSASESTVQLTAATQKISGVIQLIRKITEKINLLALNAGIESVRAGEAGKGFAVVAQEVKTLATQTKRATEDIVDNIMALQECTDTTETMLSTASHGIDKVAAENENMLGKIKAQHKLTNNIAYNMQHATSIIKDVSGNIDHIHDHISDVDSASKNVTSAARQLNAQASILSQEVQRFLKDIDASAGSASMTQREDAA